MLKVDKVSWLFKKHTTTCQIQSTQGWTCSTCAFGDTAPNSNPYKAVNDGSKFCLTIIIPIDQPLFCINSKCLLVFKGLFVYALEKLDCLPTYQ